MRRILLGTTVVLVTAVRAIAQDGMPRPDGEAVDSTQFSVPDNGERATEARVYTADRREVRVPLAAYESPTLRGKFLAQWMFIRQQGRIVEFWGARVIRLNYDSPLRALGIRPGDVLTRLDGIPIWRGMFREQGQPWQIVELEQHFGLTETRFIAHGTHQVRVGQMNLDTYPDDPAPLPP